MKIHAKTTLVVRREGDLLRRYAHIGTGNYHATTARSYEDFGLFTDDEEITADVADLFNFLTGLGRPQRFRKIVVAPFTLRSRLLEETRRVAEAAKEGVKARIRIKVNALSDPEIIEALYAASQAGARIEIVCRGICTLVPGAARGVRADPRRQRARPLPRAQPCLLVPDRARGDGAHRQRRPDAPQPRPPGRGARPAGGPAAPRRGTVCFRLAPGRQHAGVGIDADGSWERVRRAGRGRRGTHARLMSRRAGTGETLGRALMLRFLRRERRDGDDLQPCETEPVMRVAVIDVGANTVRLLVAELHAGIASPLEEDKEQLSLGAEVERDGRISDATSSTPPRTSCAASRRVRGRSAPASSRFSSPRRAARRRTAASSSRRSHAASTQARVLSAEEEGALAFRGATSSLEPIDGNTLVCDVGGGSTQLVLGSDPRTSPGRPRSTSARCA